MLKTRYRVNLHIYFWEHDGKGVVYDVHHIGFWGNEQMARDVIAGLDLRGLAFHYAKRPDTAPAALRPVGRVIAVVGPLVENEAGAIVTNGPDIGVRTELYGSYAPPPVIEGARAA